MIVLISNSFIRGNVRRGNARLGKCHSGNCPSGKCLFGELSCRGTALREIIEEMTSGNCQSEKNSSGKCPSGNCPDTVPTMVHYVVESFFVWRRRFSPLVPVAFVSKCFYHNLCWYFQLILFSQYAALPKKPANLLYQEERLKIFFWSYKEGLY